MSCLLGLALGQTVPEDSVETQLLQTQQRLEESEEKLAQTEARLAELEAPSQLSGDTEDAVVVEAGEVLPEVVGFGVPVEVHGRVVGRAVSFGRDVRVHNGAQVEGDAVSFGGEVLVEPGGRVDGDQISYRGSAAMSTVSALTEGRTGALRGFARKLVALFTFAGLGILVVGLFPKRVDVVARTVADTPVKLTLIGVLLMVFVVLLVGALSITVVLSPLALGLAVLLAFGWLLGFVGLCQAAGDTLPLHHTTARRWLAFLVGVAALAFVGVLPWIGKTALLIVGFTCVGTAWQTRFGVREPL